MRSPDTNQCEPVVTPLVASDVASATIEAVTFAFRQFAGFGGYGKRRQLLATGGPTLRFAWDGSRTAAFELKEEGVPASDPLLESMRDRFVEVLTSIVPVLELVVSDWQWQ